MHARSKEKRISKLNISGKKGFGLFMKTYRVNVNGTNYEVALEEIKGGQAPATAAPAPAPAAAPAPAPAAAPAPAPADGTEVKSPMPGTILSVNVKAGDSVKSGQVLMVLEAMKMENEIMAPVDGTIASVGVSQGASVESGALLCVIA